MSFWAEVTTLDQLIARAPEQVADKLLATEEGVAAMGVALSADPSEVGILGFPDGDRTHPKFSRKLRLREEKDCYNTSNGVGLAALLQMMLLKGLAVEVKAHFAAHMAEKPYEPYTLKDATSLNLKLLRDVALEYDHEYGCVIVDLLGLVHVLGGIAALKERVFQILIKFEIDPEKHLLDHGILEILETDLRHYNTGPSDSLSGERDTSRGPPSSDKARPCITIAFDCGPPEAGK